MRVRVRFRVRVRLRCYLPDGVQGGVVGHKSGVALIEGVVCLPGGEGEVFGGRG